LVDVRDVADAHMAAGYTPGAHGRYITSAHNTNFLEMALALQGKYGNDFPLPKKALPKWLIMIVGPLMNKMMTRKFLRNNINIEWRADNSKIKKELGISFLPLEQTMEDSFQVLVDNEILKP
jgi:nucleoside-diphosphate-sugar epimerase